MAKLGGTPSIKLIMMVNQIEKPSEASVTIKLVNKAKYTYIKFTGSSLEQAVPCVKLFHYLPLKLELV